jgi:uncharacterized paraquat-inducible protein A
MVMKENTYSLSKTKEEWYQEEIICNECDCYFIAPFEEGDILFCPRCGTKLIWDGIKNYEQ